MRIIWEVQDGYIGKSRPQITDVPDEELDECETEEQKEDLIQEYIQNDFEQIISWCEVNRK